MCFSGTNIETPIHSIGAKVTLLNTTMEGNWQVNVDEVEQLLLKHPETKLVSVTNPHNPTGVLMPKGSGTIERLIQLTAEHGKRTGNTCFLLVDETYMDMNFDAPVPIAASLAPHVITVSSLSKSYGLPGIRMGWCITQHEQLMYTLLAAKEQIVITNSIVDEELALLAYSNRDTLLKTTREIIDKHRAILLQWLKDNADKIECAEPKAGVVCFPRLKLSDAVLQNKDKEAALLKHFYKVLQQDLKTFVGAGHWFGMSDRYFRVGYGWPKTEELTRGLACIITAYDAAVKEIAQ